jgi:hypothetical protein
MIDDTEQSGNSPGHVVEHEPQSDEAVIPVQGGHRFTIATAAEACDISEMTIKRGLSSGKFPHAIKEPIPGGGGTERWSIPLTDLLAAGYRPNASKPEVIDLTNPHHLAEGWSGTPSEPPELVQLREQLEAEKERSLRAEHRADIAEALATERNRSLETLTLALRQLGQGQQAPSVIPMTPLEQAPQATRRHWWQRRSSAG